MGVPASAPRPGTADLIALNSRWDYDDLPYWNGEVDLCINAMTLLNGVWLGRDLSVLAAWFPEHRMADGGWNCEWVDGSVRSSFHSTLNAIRGLLGVRAAERCRVGAGGVGAGGVAAPRPGLPAGTAPAAPVEHRRAGGRWVDHYAYPFRARYSAFRAPDHFRQAALFDRTPPDPRLAAAIALVRAAAGDDGRWIRRSTYPGQIWFDIDEPVGRPSKWLTFHALRVLRWWNGSSAG